MSDETHHMSHSPYIWIRTCFVAGIQMNDCCVADCCNTLQQIAATCFVAAIIAATAIHMNESAKLRHVTTHRHLTTPILQNSHSPIGEWDHSHSPMGDIWPLPLWLIHMHTCHNGSGQMSHCLQFVVTVFSSWLVVRCPTPHNGSGQKSQTCNHSQTSDHSLHVRCNHSQSHVSLFVVTVFSSWLLGVVRCLWVVTFSMFDSVSTLWRVRCDSSTCTHVTSHMLLWVVT